MRYRDRAAIVPVPSLLKRARSSIMDLCGFTLIVDDIVLPDGRTCMQQLGGGGPQTLFGFQLISRCLQLTTQVGLAAGVGADLPESCKDWLQHIGCNTSGLFVGSLPTPRAWQLFEKDGGRTQVWRVKECDELYGQLRPTFEQLPASFKCSRHYHLGIHAGHPPMKLLRALRNAADAQGGLLSVETYTCCDCPPPTQQLTALLQLVDIFSPNETEAESIVGPGSPQQLAQRLVAAGARTVTLRMGPNGVLVADRSSNMMWLVPAVPNTQVVDVTGCGNAFCGGFLAGLNAGLSMLDSARWGCVAGSIMAEWQGVPTTLAIWEQVVQQAAVKHTLLQASGFEAGAVDDELSCKGNGGNLDSPEEQAPVPAAIKSSNSSSAVGGIALRRRACGLVSHSDCCLQRCQTVGHARRKASSSRINISCMPLHRHQAMAVRCQVRMF